MKKLIVFALIFVFALSLRLYHLDKTPPGLTWDEAALGYNAYSILKTGKDEFGVSFPIIFKSFGDYKPGVYVYLTVPSVAIFGLNEFAVRFPSALFGALGVVGLGLLVALIFENFSFGVIASLILAVMPWHLHFSRGAWEVNVFVTFLIYALYFFFLSLKNKKVPLLISVFLICLTFFTYQAAKLLTPLVFLVAIALNFKAAKEAARAVLKKDMFLLPLYAIFFVFVGLYMVKTATGPVGNRVARLSIFQYRPDLSHTDSPLFHNQIDLTLRAVASRYLYHFSPEILFKENNTPRESFHDNGLLYLTDAVFIFFGLIFLSRHQDKKKSLLVFGLLLSAPLGASLTLSEYSAVRALFITVPFAIISAAGASYLLKSNKVFFSLVTAIYVFNVILGLDIYFNHSDAFFAPGFNDGYKQAVQRIKENPTKKVYFTDVFGQPYIYYLFYTAYDPAKYQANNNFVDGGVDVGHVPSVDNIEFHQFSVDDIKTQKDTLFIGTIGNIPDTFNQKSPFVAYFDQINYPDGNPVFRVVKTNP